MKTLFKTRIRGFTVIELMIVVMIVAILVALAYPSYVNYVRKAKRGEAQQLLLNWAINQEIWRSNNTAYNDVTDSDDAAYIVPAHDNYSFVPSAVSGTTYTLTANASGDQANDKARDGTECDSIWLSSNGVKEPAPCWD